VTAVLGQYYLAANFQTDFLGLKIRAVIVVVAFTLKIQKAKLGVFTQASTWACKMTLGQNPGSNHTKQQNYYFQSCFLAYHNSMIQREEKF